MPSYTWRSSSCSVEVRSFFFAIVISGVKIVMIPILRGTVLPGFIRTFECSAAKLEVYSQNTVGKHLFVQGDEIFMKAGMPMDAKSVEEVLVAAATKGEGSQLKQTFDAWNQDANFVSADAVYKGDFRKLYILKTCGFNVRDRKEKYTHPEVDGGSPVSFENFAPEKTTLHEGQVHTRLHSHLGLC